MSQDNPNASIDPRPDLTGDSKWWIQLLAAAQDMDPSLEFYGILHYFRSLGTRLVLMTDGTFRMRPRVDASGNIGWISETEYVAATIKWLGPAETPNRYGEMLKESLQKMRLGKRGEPAERQEQRGREKVS